MSKFHEIEFNSDATQRIENEVKFWTPWFVVQDMKTNRVSTGLEIHIHDQFLNCTSTRPQKAAVENYRNVTQLMIKRRWQKNNWLSLFFHWLHYFIEVFDCLNFAEIGRCVIHFEDWLIHSNKIYAILISRVIFSENLQLYKKKYWSWQSNVIRFKNVP